MILYQKLYNLKIKIMAAEDFVKNKYPKAIVIHFKTNDIFDKKGYWLCLKERGGKILSEGKSESNAWVNAKKYIK